MNFRTAQFKPLLELLARKKLGTRWAKYSQGTGSAFGDLAAPHEAVQAERQGHLGGIVVLSYCVIMFILLLL